jgi:enoyl-CoA hydratase/carnithine racemase
MSPSPPLSTPLHPPPPAPPPRPKVALGIPVPKYWAALMGRAIGHAAAERLVLSGRMVKAPEALSLGLVDALAPSDAQDDVMALAARWVEAAVKLPAAARAATKQSGRAEFCAEWRRYYVEDEPAYGWAAISAPGAVAMMKAVLARLSGGGGGKKQQPSKL